MRASTQFTRPANTTAYAAEDAISDSASAPTVLTFGGLGYSSKRDGGPVRIKNARILTSQATCVARLRLHLYYGTAPSPINDNAQFTGPLYADRASHIGSIDFPALDSEGTGATAAYAAFEPDVRFGNINLKRDVYGMLETLDVFTPASEQTFFIELNTEPGD